MLIIDMEEHPNKPNWCSLTKDLLCSLGLYDAWFYQEIGNVKLFLCLVKQRLKDNFIQDWHSRLDMSSRARFYKNVSGFRFQPYLNILNITKFRMSVSKLRLSSHRLSIETGRWNRPQSTPLNERICTVCTLLEDAYHFLLECTLYNELRVRYLPRHYRQHPSMYKLVELFNTENDTILKNLSVFIFKAFELRNITLYKT